MALDMDALQTEVESIGSALRVTWRQRIIFLEGKLMEAQLAGGITSYTINGRTVTKDVRWLNEAHDYAQRMANVEESGGIDVQPISFGRRV
jgi:hypothetical protein